MITLKEILTFQAENRISDLHLITDELPYMREHKGKLSPLNETPLTKDDINSLINEMLSKEEINNLEKNRGYDFAREFDNLGRFRVNIFYEMRGLGLNIRLIDEKLIDIDKMEVPKTILDIINNRTGLFLITGPNNSGKTTLLNSFIDHLNATRQLKIITFEDPIEFVHKHKKSLISQRTIENSLEANAQQLKYVFRQDANVICIGEIRDYNTMNAVMTMCEAGYFVIATLHTTGAVQAMERIVNLYPADKKDQIFSQLAEELRGVLSQTLVQHQEENEVIPCREIFIPDDASKSKIKAGDLSAVYRYMETTSQKGNILFDQYLAGLYRQGVISKKTLLNNYHNKELMETLVE